MSWLLLCSYLRKSFQGVFLCVRMWEGVSPSILIFFRHTSSVLAHLPASKFGSHISSCSISSYLVIAFVKRPKHVIPFAFVLCFWSQNGHTTATSRTWRHSSSSVKLRNSEGRACICIHPSHKTVPCNRLPDQEVSLQSSKTAESRQ